MEGCFKMFEASIDIPQHLMYFLTVVKCYESNFNKYSGFEEINTVESLILLEIYDRECLNQIDLVEKFHVTESNISQAVKKLLEKDLIVKKVDPKKNSRNLIYFTDKSRKLCEQMLIFFRDWNNKMVKDIPMDDLVAIGETLEKIYGNCVELF